MVRSIIRWSSIPTVAVIATAMSWCYFGYGRIYSITWDSILGLNAPSGALIIFLFCIYALVTTFYAQHPKSPTALRVLNTLVLVGVIYMTILTYADACASFGVFDNHLSGAPVDKSANACFYFSIITFTTVGYGDLTPTLLLRPIAASEAMVGYLFLALLIASLTRTLSPS